MLKFYENQDSTIVKGADMLVSFASAGQSGTFAASLLINNHPFVNIGFFFSEFLHHLVTTDESGSARYNGEVYYSSVDKILLINFLLGPKKEQKKQFYDELSKFYYENQMKSLIIFGGIGKDFLNDTEIRNNNVDVFFLSNDSKTFDAQFHSLKSFENLVQLEDKKKHLQEFKFMEKCSPAKDLVKHLHKTNVPFHYLFAYSADLFDPQAGLALYFKIANLLKLKDESVILEKHRDNFVGYLEKLEKDYNLKFEPLWRLFLKE